MRPLRIAVYYPWIYLASGAERTLLELARRSRHEIVLFTSRYEPEATYPELRQLDVRVLDDIPVRRSFGSVLDAARRILLRKLDLRGFDALLVLCEGLGDLVTVRNRSLPTFNLCLTPLRIAFDPTYRARYLQTLGPVRRLLVRTASLAFRGVDRLLWRRYRRIFPISQEVRRRILDGRLAPPERQRVIHPGVDLSLFSATPSEERTFFVPGRIMWTKHLELAIESFRRFRARLPQPGGWRLRIAGAVDVKSQPYLERLRELCDGDPAIEIHTRPTDSEMRHYYRRCYATLFTAFNEDWGLVLLEAMASGKPVIATDRGGPREIVRHGENGLLAEPDADAFAAAMLRLAQDHELRNSMAAAASRSARRFGWDRFVDELDGELERELCAAGRTSRGAAEREVAA